MGTRRRARECALQLLFQLDVNPSDKLDEVFDEYWRGGDDVGATNRRFAEELVRGTLEHRAEIDAVLVKRLEHWDLSRLGGIERNVMRMAVFEMLHRTDVPPVVSINEAVDVAKFFSATESGRFVNGVLDRIREGLTRSARQPQAPARAAPAPEPADEAGGKKAAARAPGAAGGRPKRSGQTRKG